MNTNQHEYGILFSSVFIRVYSWSLSAALFLLGTGLHPWWWCMWLAPLPLLLLAPRLTVWQAFGVSASAYVVGSLNLVPYLRAVLPLPLLAGLLLVPACLFGFGVVFARAFQRRELWWAAALAMPAYWTAVEYLQSLVSIHGTFGSIAYTQMDCLPLLQIASLCGASGITFVLLLGSSLIATRRVAGAIVLLLVVGFGWWRLSSGAGPTVMAGLAASDLPLNIDVEGPERNGRLLREYASPASVLAAQGAQVIVLPEKLAVVPTSQTATVDAWFQEVADRSGAEIVVGVLRLAGDTQLNEARWYSPHAAVATYEKHHMLPPFESKMLVGTTRIVAARPSGTWGVAICKDMDFPKLSRENAADGVGLLLVPAWDFVDDGWLHDRMAVMRGVESGFTIVRAAKQGLLSVSDNRGRVLAERNTGAAPWVTMIAAAPVHREITLYARWGDWFAWLDLLLLLLLVLAVRLIT